MNNFPPISNRNAYNSPNKNDHKKSRNMIHSNSDFISNSSNKVEYYYKILYNSSVSYDMNYSKYSNASSCVDLSNNKKNMPSINEYIY